jgi:hypothetical protein
MVTSAADYDTQVCAGGTEGIFAKAPSIGVHFLTTDHLSVTQVAVGWVHQISPGARLACSHSVS